MIDINNFEKHLSEISNKNWDSLFHLLPEIKETKKFGELVESKMLEDGSYSFPYWNSTKIVDETFNIIDRLNLAPIFDWMNWEEGRQILANKNYDYSSLDILTLCKLLTCIIRLDRFSEGHLISKFEDKTIEKILENISLKVNNINHLNKKNNRLSFKWFNIFKS